MGLYHSRARTRRKNRQSRGEEFVSVPATASGNINDSLSQRVGDDNHSRSSDQACSSSSLLPISSHLNGPISSSTLPFNPNLQLFTPVSGQNSHLGHSEHDPCSSCLEDSKIHCQIDYIHCLVPDLLAISNQPFYWGEIDRFEADKLLQNQPEGTFLLRNSIQDDFLFSVSFRKYERTLHARIEQKDHFFSFASHDPSFHKSNTVCGLIEYCKDSQNSMPFEPTLTRGLNRNFPFTLQHLCRAVICSNLDYDSINKLHLPRKLCSYLREYHYKQQVRVKKFDDG